MVLRSVCLTGAAQIILAMQRGELPVMMCCYSLTHWLLASTHTHTKKNKKISRNMYFHCICWINTEVGSVWLQHFKSVSLSVDYVACKPSVHYSCISFKHVPNLCCGCMNTSWSMNSLYLSTSHILWKVMRQFFLTTVWIFIYQITK